MRVGNLLLILLSFGLPASLAGGEIALSFDEVEWGIVFKGLHLCARKP